MYDLLANVFKYALTFIIYLFIFRVTKLIYQDIKTLSQQEDKKSTTPHLKRLSTLNQESHPVVAEIFPLTKTTTTIGRVTSCDIVLSEQYVSSMHAKIEKELSYYVLVDLGSANGTYLNKQKLLAPTPLKEGDAISFGPIVLLYSEGGH